MTTAAAVASLKAGLPPGTSVVCTLGRTADVVWGAFGEHALYLDSLGDVTPVAMGLAVGLPQYSVLAIDSDGSHLFGLSNLPTLAALSGDLHNLTVAVVDNELYESAGGLPSRYCTIDWPTLGQAFGIRIHRAASAAALQNILESPRDGLLYVVLAVSNADPVPECVKPIDGIESRYRFMRHLEGVMGKQLLRPALKS